MSRKKETKPELKVVFDTSVLFTQVASDLVRSEVRSLIEANSHHVDLNIQWCLPSMVVDERRYQMQRKAFDLLPSIIKLEKLLGHNLNITEAILTHRVDEAIASQLKELGIKELNIDINTVDWNALIKQAAFRRPPFDPGEKEKGFRDALIAETFLQLLQNSPATPAICRLAIVTDDELLAKHIKETAIEAKNVRVLSNISELESLINTLVSEVTEEFVAELSNKASKYFFEEDNNTCLYYKEKISEKINESHREKLKAVPTDGLIRENGTWWIGNPVFIKKERQRLSWITPIHIDAKLSRYELIDTASSNLGIQRPALDVEKRHMYQGLSGLSAGLSGLPALPPMRKVDVGSGKTIFEIHWSVNITSAKKLSAPQIDKIVFVATKWDEINNT